MTLHRQRPDLGGFDLAHLQALHHWLFAAVYDWAGELRTINVSKDTTVFALAQHLQAQGRAILDPLQGGAAMPQDPRITADPRRFGLSAAREGDAGLLPRVPASTDGLSADCARHQRRRVVVTTEGARAAW